MSDKIFNSIWLEERFRFDNAARSKKVEKAFFESIMDLEKISIVDLGSGTGANFLYFFEKISMSQNWFLIEKDKRFIDPTFQRLENFATQKGYSFQRNEQSIKIQNASKYAEVTLVSDSFFKLSELVNLEKIDVIMAAALFDLLSESQYNSIAETIFSNNIPLFATMNYADMVFEPSTEEDEKYINLYNDHMRRDQHFGRGMGNEVVSFMENYFARHSIQFIKGKSDWKIGKHDLRMQEILLNFIENAVGELLQENEKNAFLKKWMKEKRALSSKQLLSIEVAHFDIFALPN